MFPQIKRKKLVGLGGPSLDDYMQKIPPIVEDIEIWENDIEVLGEQIQCLTTSQGKKIRCYFGDILEAKVSQKAFYDLDFCCTIDKALPHLRRFKDCAFCITLSLRGKSVKETLSKFLVAVDERGRRSIQTKRDSYNMFSTDKNTYMYTNYCDSSAMITIFKFH